MDANAKKIVGERAVEWVKDGMSVGLGTGSTVYWTIMKLGELVRQGLNIRCIPTSLQTAEIAKEQSIPLVDFTTVDGLDVCIDGADEVDASLHLTKGGGGALLREKFVASASRQLVIIAEKRKYVQHLGQFPLPVEIVQFGHELTARRVESLGCKAVLRTNGDRPFVTDNGNYILDCHFGTIANPPELDAQLQGIVGVVETGLFIQMADIVLFSDGREPEIHARKQVL